MPKLSIIVPVYNSEKYLHRCVDSILKQTYQDFELLLIDDGSSDDSAKIIANYEEQDSRVKGIYQENHGVSVARNTGMRLAKGEYLMFVDSDDYLINSLDALFMTNDLADLTVMSTEIGSHRNLNDDEFFDGDELIKAQVKMITDPTRYMTVWGKLFNTEIIKANGIRFNSQLRVAEDGDFMLQYLLHIASLRFTKHCCYHYSVESESVMSRFDNKKDDYLKAMLESQLVIDSAPAELQKAFATYVMIHFIIIMVHETFASQNPLKYGQRIRQLTELLAEPVFKEALAQIKLKDCHGLKMLPIALLKMHLKYLASILFIVRAKQNENKLK